VYTANFSQQGTVFMGTVPSGGQIDVYRGNSQVAVLGTDEHGGVVQVAHMSRQSTASMSSGDSSDGYVSVGIQGTTRINIDSRGSGMALRVLHGNEEVAAIGDGYDGGGINLRSRAGAPVTTLGVDLQGGGYFQVQNKAGTLIADLSESPASHAGYFMLGSPGGNVRVEAGVLAGDKGVVRVFGPGGVNFISGRSVAGG